MRLTTIAVIALAVANTQASAHIETDLFNASVDVCAIEHPIDNESKILECINRVMKAVKGDTASHREADLAGAVSRLVTLERTFDFQPDQRKMCVEAPPKQIIGCLVDAIGDGKATLRK